MAPIVTTGGYSWEKDCISFASSLSWRPCESSLYRSTEEKNFELCVSSLCQDHAQLLRIAKRNLELCVSSLCQGHANLLKKRTSRIRQPCGGTTLIFTVSSQLKRNLTALMLGSCVIFELLDVLSRVPVFAPHERSGVSLAEDAAVTHQEHSQLLHSSAPGHVSDPWPLCFGLQHLLPSPLHEESVRQLRFQHSRAQEISHSSLRARRSPSPASVPGASMLLSQAVLAGPSRTS